MDIYTRNIEIFNDTRKLSLSRYKSDTESSILGTTVYGLQSRDSLGKGLSKKPEIIFKNCGTINGALDMIKSGSKRVGVLNFADALVPGGLVLSGETTQEECLCRSTSLYECLIIPKCKEHYYGYNLNFVRKTNCEAYSHRLIYSKGVRIIKDDNYELIKDDKFIDIITCPSPSCEVKDGVFRVRINNIYTVSALNGCDSLVLGAWGCGAFGQNPEKIGCIFAECLSNSNYFRKVMFAIKATDGYFDGSNFMRFKNGFYSFWSKL